MLRRMCAAPPPPLIAPHENVPHVAIHLANLDQNLQESYPIRNRDVPDGGGIGVQVTGMGEPKADTGERAAMGQARAKHLDDAPAFTLTIGQLRRMVRDELAAAKHPVDDWRDQHQSPLGPRRHCRAVRLRLRANPGDPTAKILGDRFLLTPDAVAEELSRQGRKPDAAAPVTMEPPPPQSPEAEVRDRIRRRLERVK